MRGQAEEVQEQNLKKEIFGKKLSAESSELRVATHIYGLFLKYLHILAREKSTPKKIYI